MDEQSDSRAAHAGQHAPRTRKHMGVATSDPEYLPPVQDNANQMPERGHSGRTIHAAPDAHHGRGEHLVHSSRTANAGRNAVASRNTNPLHYDRYLSAPYRGRAIFSAQRTRQRRRTAMVVLTILLIAVACVAAAYFLLR